MILEAYFKKFMLIRDEVEEIDLCDGDDSARGDRRDQSIVGWLLMGKPFNLKALLGAFQGL